MNDKVKSTFNKLFGRTKIPVSFGRVTIDDYRGSRSIYQQVMTSIQNEQIEFFGDLSKTLLDGGNIDRLLLKVVQNDPTLDLAVSSYMTLSTLDHNITSESDRAQREIDSILQMMEEKKSPLSLVVAHLASSMIVRGNSCIEVEFENLRPYNLHVIDPIYFEWQKKGNNLWKLGQYDGNNEWNEIDSPNVRWDSINPLIGSRIGYSQIQTALPSVLNDNDILKDLSQIIEAQAFVKRYITFNVLKMKEAGFTNDEIKAWVKEAEESIGNWSKLKPNQIPTGLDIAQWNQEGGVGSSGNLRFVDIVDRVLDRKAIRGTKTPAHIMGSNEFVAESSADSQSIFYSIIIGGTQDRIKEIIEWAITRMLRSLGIPDAPIYTSQRTNTIQRVAESQAFRAAVDGIKVLVDSGVPLPLAIKIYSVETNTTFSGELISEIEQAYEEEQERLVSERERFELDNNNREESND